MREIKFRAWDKRVNKIIYRLEIEFYDDSSYGINRCGDYYSDNEQNCTLMQYTGLKDKNGKEIYTGDILEYWFDSFNPLIGYLTSRSYFANNIPFPDENYKKTGTKFVEQVICKDGTFLLTDGKDEVYLNMHCRNAEIIGNIRENPELVNNEITI